MNAYILLLLAVIAEVIATSFLKLSHGFTKLIPSIVVVLFYSSAFWLMSLTLKTLPVSIVYAIWSGLGIAGIAVIGVFFYKENFGIWHLLGTFLILMGVLILNMVTKSH